MGEFSRAAGGARRRSAAFGRGGSLSPSRLPSVYNLLLPLNRRRPPSAEVAGNRTLSTRSAAGLNFQNHFAPTRMLAESACYKTAAHETPVRKLLVNR